MAAAVKKNNTKKYYQKTYGICSRKWFWLLANVEILVVAKHLINT